jgi:hypothetical protein
VLEAVRFPPFAAPGATATALVGKWHLNSDLGSTEDPQPTDQGFDYFYDHNAFQV